MSSEPWDPMTEPTEPVLMFVSIYDMGTTPNCRHELWARPLPTDWPPSVGDEVALWADPDDGSEGPLWVVRRRWWLADGWMRMELQDIVVDPTEEEMGHLRSPLGIRRSRPWWTNSDGGRPESRLEIAGWYRWSSRRRGRA